MAVKTEKSNGTLLFIIRGMLILLLNLIFYVVVVLGAVELCKVSYSFANEVFGEVMAEAPPGRDIEFRINESDDMLTIAKNLEKEGIVANAYSFYIRLKFSLSVKSVVVAGDYTLNTSMTYEEILDKIVKGVS